MKLFFSAGACSFAPHIILRELDIDFELVSVDTPEQKYGLKATGEFQKVNPGGTIPALVLDSGEVLTECSAILVFLSSIKSESNLFPAPGTFEMIRGLEWLNQIATEWHKQFVFLFWPSLSIEMQEKLLNTARLKLERLNEILKGKDFIFDDNFSIIDAYLLVALGWIDWADPKEELKVSNYSEVNRYVNQLNERPSVIEALKYEANQFEGN